MVGGSTLAGSVPSAVAAAARDSGERYAVVGDGVADDGPAIQTALDAAETAGGGVVVLPPGIFTTTRPLFKPREVELVGAGPAATTIKADPARFPLTMAVERKRAHDDATLKTWTVPAAVLHTTAGPSEQGGMRGFKIDGSRREMMDPLGRAAPHGVTGYYLLVTANHYVYDVTVEFAEVGLLFDSTQNWRCFGVRLRECGVGVLCANHARVGRLYSVDARRSLRADVVFGARPELPGAAFSRLRFPDQITIRGGVLEPHEGLTPDDRSHAILVESGSRGRGGARELSFDQLTLVSGRDNTAMRALVELRGGDSFRFQNCMFNGGADPTKGADGRGIAALHLGRGVDVTLTGCKTSGIVAPRVFEGVVRRDGAWVVTDDVQARVHVLGALSWRGRHPPDNYWLGPVGRIDGLTTAPREVWGLRSLLPDTLHRLTAIDPSSSEVLGRLVFRVDRRGRIRVLDIVDRRDPGLAPSFEWRFNGYTYPPDQPTNINACTRAGTADVEFHREYHAAPPDRPMRVVGADFDASAVGARRRFAPLTLTTLPAGTRSVEIEVHLANLVAGPDDGGPVVVGLGDDADPERFVAATDWTHPRPGRIVRRVAITDPRAPTPLVAQVRAVRARFDVRVRPSDQPPPWGGDEVVRLLGVPTREPAGDGAIWWDGRRLRVTGRD